MDLENNYYKGQDDYLDTITAAYNILISYKYLNRLNLVIKRNSRFPTRKPVRHVAISNIQFVISVKKGHCVNKYPSINDDSKKY